MRLSRRQLLSTSFAALAAGCARLPGRGDEPQTFGPGAVDVGNQVLDPALHLSLPEAAVSPAFLERFRSRTGVRVSVRPEPSGEELLLELAAGASGKIDVALVDDATLAFLVAQQDVEPLARSLLPNRDLLAPPFSDPPFDPGGRHSVPKDYTVLGYALVRASLFDTGDTWAGLFRMAESLPGRVAVPDDPVTVVGAALVSLGLDWNSESAADLDAARRTLLALKGALAIGGRRRAGRGGILAAVGPGSRYVEAGPSVRFVVPAEGTAIRMRSYCIPIRAPDPVTAHAWMNASLDPAVAAEETLYTRRASPVADANFLLPVDVLANPAVYPPAQLVERLGFTDLSEDGLAARADIWKELTR
jgi:spermidine/putrescine transport system substrate-binding protein